MDSRHSSINTNGPDFLGILLMPGFEMWSEQLLGHCPEFSCTRTATAGAPIEHRTHRDCGGVHRHRNSAELAWGRARALASRNWVSWVPLTKANSTAV